MQKELTFHTEDAELNYLLYLPKYFQQNESKKWPLILFLHGAGERGNNLDLVKLHGVSKIVENRDYFPFIVVSPQCSANSYWVNELDTLSGLLDEIVQEYPVDNSRIYLTGLSMGGIGAWHLAIENPKRFAALAPVCGALSLPKFRQEEFQYSTTSKELFAKLSRLKDLPVWAFHGDNDEVVPMEETKKIIEILTRNNGEAKLTIYEGVGHDSWTETYENEELYTWFLENGRK